MVVVRFDAYTATTLAVKPGDVLPWFFEGKVGGQTLHMGKGFHTFKDRIAVKDASGKDLTGGVSELDKFTQKFDAGKYTCLLYTSPSPRDRTRSRMPSSA